MGRIKNLDDCRYARDFARIARRGGAEVIEGGRHTIVKHNGGHVAIPRHGEIKPGTRKAIVKAMIALGLGILLLVVLPLLSSLVA